MNAPLIVGLTFSRPVHPHWVMGMLSQSWPMNLSKRYIVTQNIPIDEARESIASRAIELGATYIWFVDDDTVPPSGAIRALKYQLDQNPDVAAIGGICCTKTDPPEPVVFKAKGGGASWDWKMGEVFECEGVSMACMLVRVEAIKDIPQPLFKMGDYQSESMYFCDRLREAGHKLLAHGGVICDHLDSETGTGYSLPSDSYPVQHRAEGVELLA